MQSRTKNSPAHVTTSPPYLSMSPTESATEKSVLQETSPSLLNTAFRAQMYQRFVADYTPHSVNLWPPLSTNLLVLPSTSWLTAAAAVAPTDAVLNNALMALALAQIGRTTEKTDFMWGSRRLYAEAVSGVNKKLRTGTELTRDTTLAAVSALSIYEVCSNKYAR